MQTIAVIMIKRKIKSIIGKLGYEIRGTRLPQVYSDIPDSELYYPLFSPWLGAGEFGKYYKIAASKTLVSSIRCHILYSLLLQALNIGGDIWECGVYKGGTAAMIASILKDRNSSKKLYLFDTFEGMPETDLEKDRFKKGDFSDTTVEAVADYVGCSDISVIRKGIIPATFVGLESASIALAHVDVDIYKSIVDCLNFIWPRLSIGGFIVFDDYGFPSCPGARAAVDAFFSNQKCVPLCLPTGQALIFKGIA